MDDSAKKKLLEEKLIASMKTEITLLKKLKHLAFHRGDKETHGNTPNWCSSSQLSFSLHSSVSDLATVPRLNGLGTHVDKFKRAGPLHQLSLHVQPTSASHPELARCTSVEVLVTNEAGFVNGSGGQVSRPSSVHSNYSSDAPVLHINGVDGCDLEDSPSDDTIPRSLKLTQWGGSESMLQIPSASVQDGYEKSSWNEHRMTRRLSSSLDGDIRSFVYSSSLKDVIVSPHPDRECSIVRRSSVPTAGKPPPYPKPRKKVEKQKKVELDENLMVERCFSTFQGLLATKPDHWLEKYLSQDWRSVCSDCNEVTEEEASRRDKVWEVLYTEVKYFISQLQPLKFVYKNFLVLLQNQVPPILPQVDLMTIFGNINDLYELSMSVAIDILKLFQFKPASEVATASDLVSVFKMFGAKFNPVYQCYAMNYERARHSRQKMLSTPGYKKYLELCQSVKLCHRLKLEDLLISPVKHLGHYPLLLKDIIRHTHDVESESLLQSALKAFSVALKELESHMSHYKELLHLEDLHHTIHWPKVADMDPDAYVPPTLQFKLSEQPCQQLLMMEGRVYLHEGNLKLIGSRGQIVKKLQGVLLSDCLLLTEYKKLKGRTKASVVHKEPIPLQYVEVFGVGEDDLPCAFCCVVSNVFKQHTALYTLQADSKESKEEWLQRLKTAQQDMSLHN